MTKTLSGDQARVAAQQWLECESDLNNCQEIEALLAGPEAELIERFTGHLEFGTAGLRGPLGAGPQRMNRSLVQMTAAAIAKRLLEENQEESPLVVIGFDARTQSDVFASDTARVLANQNIRCVLLPKVLPTPVLAFSVLQIKASAGIMVTASHNPRQDNGYKVYWKDGAQINAPLDQEISAYLDEITPNEVELASLDSSLITHDEGNLLEQYLDMAASCVAQSPESDLKIMYTPIHGVGRDTLIEVFTRAGFTSVHVLEEQAEPDPDFPTVDFPNPEVPGTLDLALAEAKKIDADLLIANDPDADRLAVVVPDGKTWRTLNGNEIGSLLAEHVLKSSEGSDRLVVTTIVSSRMLKKIAEHHNVHYEETLTGFKWIMRPGIDSQEKNFVFGYEEALGFAVGDHVHDKDGVTAALVFADIARRAKRDKRPVVEFLHDLWHLHGCHATGQVTHRFEGSEGVEAMKQIMNLIRQNPPKRIGSYGVKKVTDFSSQFSWLPATDAVAFETSQSRVVVRPSGTEPLIKIYAEVVVPVQSDEVVPREDDCLIDNYERRIGEFSSFLDKEDEIRLMKEIEEGVAADIALEKNWGANLTPTEERKLRRTVIKGEQAKVKFTKPYLHIVVLIAKKYRDSGIPLMNLIEEGNLGLDRAVEEVDWRKGFRFSTYATWWIRKAITDSFAARKDPYDAANMLAETELKYALKSVSDLLSK